VLLSKLGKRTTNVRWFNLPTFRIRLGTRPTPWGLLLKHSNDSYWFFHRVRWFRISVFLKVLKASSDFGCEELHRRDQSSELQFRRCSLSKAGNTWVGHGADLEGHLKRDVSERNADQKCAALLLHVTSRCWWSCTILHILLAWRIEFSVFY